MKKKLKTRMVFILAIIIVLILIVTYALINNYSDTKVEKINLSFKNRIDDFNKFQYENYIKIGWIQVQGTNIDYPVLNFNAGEIDASLLNYSWQSPYYFIGENREVLMGHNVINVSSTPIRDMSILNSFEGLMAFVYDDFASNNLYINYTKNGKTELYKIYAVGFYDYYSDSAESFTDDKLIKEYITKVKKNSLYDYDVDVKSDDELITLKTCTRYFGLNEKQELWVDARKVREGEDIIKYKVKKNDNYKIISLGVGKENG